jgi:hypothetical protein
MLGFTLARSELEQGCTAWNIFSADANKLQHIQQKFLVLCYSSFSEAN